MLRFARAGYDVGFCYRSRSDDAAKTESTAAESGAAVIAVQADVTDPVAVSAFVRRVEDELGPIEAAVTAAGITRDRSLLTMSDEDWTAVLRTNLDGTFHACRAAMFGMLKRRRGAVVTLSSVAGRYGNAGQTNYSAAKAAISGFTLAAAREVARYGVRVNAIAPGFIATDMTAELISPELLGAIPAKRAGTAEEVAACVRFLVSQQAGYVTGAVLTVDGGLGA